MAAGFDVRVDVDRMLARLAVIKVRWTGSSLQKIGDFAAAQILADSQQSFRRQADPTTGTPWKSSNRAQNAYMAARRAVNAGKRKQVPKRMTTLIKTGRLRRSVRSGYDLSATGLLAAWGGIEPLVYGPIHQFGGDAGRNHASYIPARPYVGLSPERSEKLRKFVLKTLAEDAR